MERGFGHGAVVRMVIGCFETQVRGMGLINGAINKEANGIGKAGM